MIPIYLLQTGLNNMLMNDYDEMSCITDSMQRNKYETLVTSLAQENH